MLLNSLLPSIKVQFWSKNNVWNLVGLGGGNGLLPTSKKVMDSGLLGRGRPTLGGARLKVLRLRIGCTRPSTGLRQSLLWCLQRTSLLHHHRVCTHQPR